jgi:hypothetical protein
MTRTIMRLWRVIKGGAPTGEDFLSAQAMGRTPRNPQEAELYGGLSMFATQQEAVDKANAVRNRKGQRVLGDYVVPVDLPDDGTIRFERTTNSPGHYTVWASPDLALSLARPQEVAPVAPDVAPPAPPPDPLQQMRAFQAEQRARLMQPQPPDQKERRSPGPELPGP